MDLKAIGIDTNFGFVDWCIVIVYLLIILGVGVYIKRYVSNVASFIVATMICSELGLVTVMYASQKGFTGGFAAFHIAVAAAVSTLLVGLTGFIVVPLRRMKVMTIPEFYERRFSRGIRILGGIIVSFAGILCMGMYLKAGSLFVMGILGMTSGVELKFIMTILLALVLLCTASGGMISVVILDYIQFIVLSVGLITATLLSIKHLGWGNIVTTVSELKGQAGFDPFSSEGFGLSYVVWMLFMGLACSAIWQTAVIRACAAKNTTVVKRLYTWSSIGYLIRFLIPYFFGISAFVFVAQTPGLRKIFMPEGGPADPQVTLMAVPVFLSQILPAGVIGLFTASMLAALMSTHNSYLLCWSAVLTQDVVAPFFKKGLSSRTRVVLTRIFIIGIGIFILVWGLWYPLGQDLWDYMAIGGAIYNAGAVSLLVFGLYWKRAGKVGAYSSLIVGFFSIVGLKPMQNVLGMDVSAAIVGLVIVGLSLTSMVVGSLLFPDRPAAAEISSQA